MYYSTNDGESWQSLRLNLPVVPITDLAVHKREGDLVVATQGRSFYVLDDLNLLYQLADAQKSDAFLFKPETAYRTPGFGGFQPAADATFGANPPNGAVVHYYLKDKPKQEIALEFLDATENKCVNSPLNRRKKARNHRRQHRANHLCRWKTV